MIKNLLLAIGTALTTNTTPIQKNNESVFNNENEIKELQPKRANTEEGIYSASATDDSLTYETQENTYAPFYLNSTYIKDSYESTSGIEGAYEQTYSVYTFNKRAISTPTYDITANINYMLTGRDNYTSLSVNVIVKIGHIDAYTQLNTYSNNDDRITYLNDNTIWNRTLLNQNYTYTNLWEDTYTIDDITFTDLNTYSNVALMIYIYAETTTNARVKTGYASIEGTFTYNAQTQEIIDLPGLLFTILGMPFSFISQAFNLTLFPGTQYSVNVANILFAIITGLLIIVIVKKVLK